MSRRARGRNSEIQLTGIYHPRVLGTFRVLRGFADLRDLAGVSVPFEMSSPDSEGHVDGHQRALDQAHAVDIRQYFESSTTRFIPEIILSARLECEEMQDPDGSAVSIRGSNDGIELRRVFSKSGIHELTVDTTKLAEIRARALIRRIDGNHRLALAEELDADATLPK